MNRIGKINVANVGASCADKWNVWRRGTPISNTGVFNFNNGDDFIEILASIDQLTFFIPSQITEAKDNVKIVDKFLLLSQLMGDPRKRNGINGYDFSYVWGPSNAIITVSFNESPKKENMGISVNLTSSGKDFLNNVRQLNEKERINYQKLLDFVYQQNGHLSRLDIAVDVIEPDISVNDLYNSIEEEKIIVKNQVGTIKTSNIQIIGKVDSKQTIYIGSRQSNAMLRIYNKKEEQEHNKNSRFKSLVKNTKKWIRFEGEFKHEYIKKLGKELAKVNNLDIVGYLIAELVKHWTFLDCNEKVIPIWQSIINAASNPLQMKDDPVVNPIYKTINYYIDGGSLGVLWRIKKIFGDKGLKIFEKFISHYLNNHYSPPQSAREDAKTVATLRYDCSSIKPYLKKIHKERVSGMKQLDYLVENIIQKLNFSSLSGAIPLIALWVLIELNDSNPETVINLHWHEIKKKERTFYIFDKKISRTLAKKLEDLRKAQYRKLSRLNLKYENDNVFVKINEPSHQINLLDSESIDLAYEKIIRGDEAEMFGDEILNAKQLREKLGVSNSFFYQLLKKGLPYHQLDDKSRKYYFLDEVEDWLTLQGLKPKTTWK